MTILTNPRQELFAQQLAKGKSANEAYRLAGYRPCRQNAHRLSSNDAIQQRIAELKMQRDIDAKNGRCAETGQFVVGHNGLGGRPRGSRNKLGEQFLTVESELFQELRDFREAWRLARSFIGADDDKLIELLPEEPIDG